MYFEDDTKDGRPELGFLAGSFVSFGWQNSPLTHLFEPDKEKSKAPILSDAAALDREGTT